MSYDYRRRRLDLVRHAFRVHMRQYLAFLLFLLPFGKLLHEFVNRQLVFVAQSVPVARSGEQFRLRHPFVVIYWHSSRRKKEKRGDACVAAQPERKANQVRSAIVIAMSA
jgi:hypothetical protein